MARRATMVLAGALTAATTERGLADGFRANGWAVQEVERPCGYPGTDIALRAGTRLLRPLAEAAYRESILRACASLRPDVFLTVKGTGLTGALLSNIVGMGIRTVMYWPDVHFQHPGVDQNSHKAYDLFVTTKTFQTEHLEERLGADRVGYVPHGYVAGVHQPVFRSSSEADYCCDTLYIGNRSAYKNEWLAALLRLNPSLDLRIVGAGWAAGTGSSGLGSAKLEGPRHGVAYAQEVQSARINIALHMGPTASGWGDLVSTRSFEIPACRGFMLHIDNPEIRTFFTPGEEIDVFSSPEELAEKIGYYLARPELRARMIERAYRRCVPHYGYGARAQEIENLLRARLWTDPDRLPTFARPYCEKSDTPSFDRTEGIQ
jgi:spore maturation protein CgeB